MAAKKNTQEIPPKPKTPQQVFTDGMLEYTIVDYISYIPPGNPLFKEGWLPIKDFNLDHPKSQAFIQKAHEKQEEIQGRGSFRFPYC